MDEQAHLPPLTPFSSIIEPIGRAERQAVRLTEDWAQGRATYGGLVGAILLQAMQSWVDPARLLRTIQITFVGPAEPGTAELQTETLRVGGSVTLMSARLVQDGTVRATAVASFGVGRESNVHIAGKLRPEAPAAESLSAFPYIPRRVPTFTRHFDMRWASGNYPFSSAERPDFTAWVRLRDGAPPYNDVHVIGLLDVFPAGVLPVLSKPCPASSLSWSVDMVNPGQQAAATDWWHYAVQTHAATEGYTQADACLWLPDGRLAAVSRQTSAVFG